ncbi:MAG: formate dehydrogenase accessory protein FdhE [Thermodesulfobacteriota bacterium]|nr:formate dehydrogenase accessory protein FdhE [Thermodesulfobacteriota bacterium]
MTPDLEQKTRRLRQKLDDLSTRDFIPKPLVRMIGLVAQRQLEAKAECRVKVPDGEILCPPDEHQQGRPLLIQSDFPFDWEQACYLFSEFADLLEAFVGPAAKAAKFLKKEIKEKRLDMDEAFRGHLEGDEKFFAGYREKTPDAPRALHFLVQAALAPSLEVVAEKLTGHDPEIIWEHGTCPICGGLPLIGRLKEKEGFRHLICSFCHTEYRAKRIACPFCGEKRHEKLPFFESEDEPGYRVDICETCNMYIKTVDFRALDKVSFPLLDDLESLTLDLLAQAEGFKRPTASGWGF